MNFSEALRALKLGFHVARWGWNGKSMWIKLQAPEPLSKMTLPYIYMYTAQGHLVPWLASQTDILADDWRYVRVRGHGVPPAQHPAEGGSARAPAVARINGALVPLTPRVSDVAGDLTQ